MKIKVTYSQVKKALMNGFVSPLNSVALSAAASLIKSLQSFRNAANPRASAGFIDEIISNQKVIEITMKSPKLKTKQNFFINYIINNIRHRNNMSGTVPLSQL